MSENCELANQEDTLIKDLFIDNMQKSEIQKELLKKTVEPVPALRVAIIMEIGQRNQLQITNSQPNLQVNAIIPQRQFRNLNQRPNFKLKTRSANQLCRNCGFTWSANHKKYVLLKAKHVTTVVFKTIVVNRVS